MALILPVSRYYHHGQPLRYSPNGLPVSGEVYNSRAMKIYDQTSKRVLANITLFLTLGEARELAGAAKDLAANPQHHHHHVSDKTFQQEITLAVYTRENFPQFDDESRRLIEPELKPD